MKHNLKGLICHDYTGLGCWAKGEWKAKNKYTERYVELTQPLYQNGLIDFKYVKGHGDCKGNIQADELANRAIMEMKKWGEPSPMAINAKTEVEVPLDIIIKKPDDSEVKMKLVKRLGEVMDYSDDFDLYNSLLYILDVFQTYNILDEKIVSRAEKKISNIWGF
jgi:hypothetical protein